MIVIVEGLFTFKKTVSQFGDCDGFKDSVINQHQGESINLFRGFPLCCLIFCFQLQQYENYCSVY